MANPSKQRPWVVQMHVRKIQGWIDVDAYRDEAEAEMQAGLARIRAPEAEWRVQKMEPAK